MSRNSDRRENEYLSNNSICKFVIPLLLSQTTIGGVCNDEVQPYIGRSRKMSKCIDTEQISALGTQVDGRPVDVVHRVSGWCSEEGV